MEGRTRWQLFDATGTPLAAVDAVVFANAGAATTLWSRATDATGRALAADAGWIAPLAADARPRSASSAPTRAGPACKPALPIAGSRATR